jgi:pimeloyl-ACP methyl ester carboxylesterase
VKRRVSDRAEFPADTMTKHEISLSIDGTDVRLSCMSRAGRGLPLVFLHGFGSTKEDYADLAQNPDFAGQPFFAYDAPGCGESWCSDLKKISIPFLVDTALAALADQGIERFHLVGHSMGGLTSLMLAHQEPGRVASFIDIEGNVAPEDCFLSRQTFLHPHEDPELFLEDFISRNFPHLAANGVQLAEITSSGHFPMYSNPPQMWNRIAAFQRQAATALEPWPAAPVQP